jgi:hypothetical protein
MKVAGVLISLVPGYLAVPAVGWSKTAAGTPSARAVSNHHPAPAPRASGPAVRHQPASANHSVRPVKNRSILPAPTNIRNTPTIHHPPINPPTFHAAAGVSPIGVKHQAAAALGGPATYDARKGAVIGTAMGHRR